MILRNFVSHLPTHEIDQAEALTWLAKAHAISEATKNGWDLAARNEFEARLRTAISRVACSPKAIKSRRSAVVDPRREDWDSIPLYDVGRRPHGGGTFERAEIFRGVVRDYFRTTYSAVEEPPSDLIHVTCTGYVSPSGAQELVDTQRWGAQTRVTHAYHMGCYAAFPAIRLAAGALCLPDSLSSGGKKRVDIVHTELCSLHFDPSHHSLEQLVVQSLFADGLIRYSMEEGDRGSGPGLSVLALAEEIVPDTSTSMSWVTSDHGMIMTLARGVPARIREALAGFVSALLARVGLASDAEIPRAVFAIHPGGPKIIDAVRDTFALSEAQIQASRDVLFSRGNMSSATLPHIWSAILSDEGIPAGTKIVSLAFGPGLTLCGGLFEKQ